MDKALLLLETVVDEPSVRQARNAVLVFTLLVLDSHVRPRAETIVL